MAKLHSGDGNQHQCSRGSSQPHRALEHSGLVALGSRDSRAAHTAVWVLCRARMSAARVAHAVVPTLVVAEQAIRAVLAIHEAGVPLLRGASKHGTVRAANGSATTAYTVCARTPGLQAEYSQSLKVAQVVAFAVHCPLSFTPFFRLQHMDEAHAGGVTATRTNATSNNNTFRRQAIVL